MLRTLPFVLTLSIYHAAAAGTVYKCVDGGRVSYGDRPCPGAGGTALAVPNAPAPDPDTLARLERQRAAVLELDRIKLAQAARDERDARDAARQRRAAQAERKRCDKLRLQSQWAKEDLGRRPPTLGAKEEAMQAQTNIKLRRQAETLALECPA